MWNELCLYLELLLFLVGTLLYGFLSRELLRRPEVLPGNRALRWLPIALTVWFAGALGDELVDILIGQAALWLHLGLAIDLLRGSAWLAFFPLLVHTLADALWRLEVVPYRRWLARCSPWLAYPTLLLFVRPAWRFLSSQEPLLAYATLHLTPLIVGVAAWNLLLACIVGWRLRQVLNDRRLKEFLRFLLILSVGLLALLVVSRWFDPWNPAASGGERFLRTVLLGGLLLPGVLMAFYVQRYNLMRLSLSQRSLRHFLSVLALVLLVMVAGPTVASADLELYRRLVAWGLLLALFFGTVYRPLIERPLQRLPQWRRLMGKTISPQELDRLMDSIQQLDLDEGQALSRAAHEVGRWLGSEADFLPTEDEAPALAGFWTYFRAVENPLVHRLAPPDPRLASLFDQHDLHAVFALRLEGELFALLGLRSSATGGGYDVAELEAVRLVIRQLAATLSLQRIVASRVAEERHLEEQERLGMLGLISASLAHEIKNPLSSIKVLAQSLREDLADVDPSSEGVADLDVIVEQIDRLHQTTHEILGLARPHSGADTRLTDLVQSALYVLAAEARKRGIHLAADPIEEVGTLPGSTASWQTVVFNLLLNAVEHTPTGGTVSIRLFSATDPQGEDRRIVFETANPGGPIDEEQKLRIFEPFVSHGGTGLGLALVQRRLQELGGTVEVRSDDGQVVFTVTASTVATSSGTAPSDDGQEPNPSHPS